MHYTTPRSCTSSLWSQAIIWYTLSLSSMILALEVFSCNNGHLGEALYASSPLLHRNCKNKYVFIVCTTQFLRSLTNGRIVVLYTHRAIGFLCSASGNDTTCLSSSMHETLFSAQQRRTLHVRTQWVPQRSIEWCKFNVHIEHHIIIISLTRRQSVVGFADWQVPSG